MKVVELEVIVKSALDYWNEHGAALASREDMPLEAVIAQKLLAEIPALDRIEIVSG